MALDREHNKLHLFGGKGMFGQWLILKLKPKLWDIRKDLSKYRVPFTFHMENAKSIVIDGSLHVFSKGMFIRYNRRKHRFMEINPIEDDDVKHIEAMVYIKRQHRIYILGAHNEGKGLNRVYSNHIWYCQHNESFTEYKWHRLSIDLPHPFDGDPLNNFKVMLGSKFILFLFYYERDEVWCIDPVNERILRCHKSVHIEHAAYSQLVSADKNIAHSLCMDRNGPSHTVVQLNEILAASHS